MRFGTACLFMVPFCIACAAAADTAKPDAVSQAGTAEVAFVPDLVYRSINKRELRLDLAYPRNRPGPLATVVLLHGSGSVAQSRPMYQARVRELAGKGYVGAFVHYRNSPNVPFPGAIHDVQSAVRWLRAQAGKFPIDRERMAVVGYSSGGALACLLAMLNTTDPLIGGDHLEQTCRVQACVSYFAPTDLGGLHERCMMCLSDKSLPLSTKFKTGMLKESLEQWLGGTPAKVKKTYEQASPISYVRKDGAPLLLLHGGADAIVPVEQAQLLEKKVKAAGGQAKLLVFDKAPHDFDELKDDNARRAFQAQWEFLEQALKPRR
jgi:acetyl esterase/lipase